MLVEPPLPCPLLFSSAIALAIYSPIVPASPAEPANYTWNFSDAND